MRLASFVLFMYSTIAQGHQGRVYAHTRTHARTHATGYARTNVPVTQEVSLLTTTTHRTDSRAAAYELVAFDLLRQPPIQRVLLQQNAVVALIHPADRLPANKSSANVGKTMQRRSSWRVSVSVAPACWLVQPDEVSVTPEHPILGVGPLTSKGPWEASVAATFVCAVCREVVLCAAKRAVRVNGSYHASGDTPIVAADLSVSLSCSSESSPPASCAVPASSDGIDSARACAVRMASSCTRSGWSCPLMPLS